MSQEITHTGTVTAVEGSVVRVLINQTSACSACHANKMCMAAESREKQIDAVAAEPLQTGDRVEVVGTSRMQTTAVLLAYVLPFFILIGMVFILNALIDNEALVGTLAIVSLLPYLMLLRLFSKRISRQMVFIAKRSDSSPTSNGKEKC